MKIIDNLLVLPICIQPVFKSLRTVSHNTPIWQTIPSIHYSVSKIKLVQVIFKTSFENSQIITPGCLDASCFQIWYHICIIFPRKYLVREPNVTVVSLTLWPYTCSCIVYLSVQNVNDVQKAMLEMRYGLDHWCRDYAVNFMKCEESSVSDIDAAAFRLLSATR